MSWGFVIGAAATVIGGAVQGQAGEGAADAHANANALAIGEQRRQDDQTRADLMPWMQEGGWALGQQRNFLEGDYGDALKSPWVVAAQEMGTAQLDAGATSEGNLWGGGADADRIKLGQQIASQGLLTHYNALAGLSQTGQATGGQLGAFGANAAGQIGQYHNANGMAQASAYANTANAWSNGLGQLGGWWAYGQQQRNPGGG
jgi:hypothetical protein